MLKEITSRQIAALCSCLALVTLLAAGCGEEAATEPGLEERGGHDMLFSRAGASGQLDTEVRNQIIDLRQATAPFHNAEKAMLAGWSDRFPPACMTHAQDGGMGFHLLNPGLVDGTVSVTEPELLVYEPGPNDKLRLVAVEYAVPVTEFDESGNPLTPRPDPLFGDKEFTLFTVPLPGGEELTVWQQHVWLWRHNPDGIFQDWNPKTDCDSADPSDVETFSSY